MIEHINGSVRFLIDHTINHTSVNWINFDILILFLSESAMMRVLNSFIRTCFGFIFVWWDEEFNKYNKFFSYYIVGWYDLGHWFTLKYLIWHAIKPLFLYRSTDKQLIVRIWSVEFCVDANWKSDRFGLKRNDKFNYCTLSFSVLPLIIEFENSEC